MCTSVSFKKSKELLDSSMKNLILKKRLVVEFEELTVVFKSNQIFNLYFYPQEY